jgi:hypothetical protein
MVILQPFFSSFAERSQYSMHVYKIVGSVLARMKSKIIKLAYIRSSIQFHRYTNT